MSRWFESPVNAAVLKEVRAASTDRPDEDYHPDDLLMAFHSSLETKNGFTFEHSAQTFCVHRVQMTGR